ncbi:MAG TPA: outer membrane beta-barrel protein [Bryobacteraceae bacterium]|nr:outer membrane beta-barrel protein [Bryobacteraceae bacterium]
MRSLLLLLAVAGGAWAQPFSAGVKLGVPLSDFLSATESGDTSYSTITNRYIVGVEGELRLPFGLGIELDVLYRHVNFSSTTTANAISAATSITTANTTSNDWEFPLVAKYKFKAPLVRPYVEAGVAWDTLQGLTQGVKTTVAGIVTSSSSTSSPSELSNSSTRGFVLGAGIDIHALLVHVTPELRYTRWGARQFFAPGLLSSNQNQAEFLVGVTF